jgi:hypothetical protein
MTHFNGLSIATIGAALSMTAGLALPATPSRPIRFRCAEAEAADPRPSVAPVDTAEQAKVSSFVDTLRNRKTCCSRSANARRSPRSPRQPKIDLEIRFDYNSADISKESVSAVQELGKTLLQRRPEGFNLRGRRSYRRDGRRVL